MSIILDYMPLMVAAITVIAGGIIYSWQKKIDRKENLREEKQKLYAQYLTSVERLSDTVAAYTVDKNTGKNYNTHIREHGELTQLVYLHAEQTTANQVYELELSLLDWRNSCLNHDVGVLENKEKLLKFASNKKAVLKEMRREFYGDKTAQINYFSGVERQ